MSTLTLDALKEQVAAVLPQIIAFRHELHSHPELSGQEVETARKVSAALERAGIPHETGIGGMHGIVATIQGGAGSGKTLALRGDMDALPILEESEVPYKSQNPGVMHACGHDGHTANLLGTALVLNASRAGLRGQVKLFFQPAEETVSGASTMVEAGCMDGVDAVLMLHGWPDVKAGQLGIKTGPAMASSDSWSLTIHGKGGHAAYPHTTVDPVLVGAQLVVALQSLVSRETSPTSPAVVSVTTFHAGTARNIIAEKAELSGTVRTLDRALRDSMPERMERLIAGICSALRAEYTFDFRAGTPPVINDVGICALVQEVGTALVGADNVIALPEPTMGAEDFSFYLEKAPGAMIRLGTGCPYLLHTPKYDFGDAPLETGMLLMAETARRFLNG